MSTQNPDRFTQTYKKDPSIVSRQIAREMILVPIRQNVGDMESIYVLNDSAMFAWALFDGIRTLGEIRSKMVEEYDIDDVQAGQDLLELVSNLERVGAVIKTDG